MDLTNQVFDALGHPTRRDILILLREGPMSVGTIAEHFPISRPAISKHLRILEGAGLVAYHEQGTRNIFSLKPEGFQEAKVYLEEFWDSALANFQRIAEEVPLTES